MASVVTPEKREANADDPGEPWRFDTHTHAPLAFDHSVCTV